jgi:hypothetical protein
VLLEELVKLKTFNDLIGNLTRDLTACSILPQPNMLLRAPDYLKKKYFIKTDHYFTQLHIKIQLLKRSRKFNAIMVMDIFNHTWTKCSLSRRHSVLFPPQVS